MQNNQDIYTLSPTEEAMLLNIANSRTATAQSPTWHTRKGMIYQSKILNCSVLYPTLPKPTNAVLPTQMAEASQVSMN